MSISKSFVQLPVQLPMLFFFILATLAGTHVWSNDRINTYEFTPEGGGSSTLFIREVSRDGAHILLSEFRSDAGQQEAGQQEAGQQEAAGAVTAYGRSVTRLIPDVSGSSNSHRVIYHPPSSPIGLSPLNPNMRVHERHHSLPGVTIPSVSVLKGLSSSPVEGENNIILALPLPARIPVQPTSLPERLCLVHGNIRQPVVEARDDSTFIVSGNVLLGFLIDAHAYLDTSNREYTARDLPAEAEFTYNPADDSVQLRAFRVPGLMTITHTSTRETSEHCEHSEHSEDMEILWLQLERYQKQQPWKEKQQALWKARQQEYINGLEASEQKLLRGLISQGEIWWAENLYPKLYPLYRNYLAFMESLDNENIAPMSSMSDFNNAGDTIDWISSFNEEFAAYLASRGVTSGNSAGTESSMPAGDNAGTESSMPEGNEAGVESAMPGGDNAGMELEPDTAGNSSLSNVPENQPSEPSMDSRLPPSFVFHRSSQQ